MQYIKCVTCGDGAVGKSALLLTFTTGRFPEEYIPTVVDNFRENIKVDGKIWSLGLWDTAGQEEYKEIRSLSYNGTDVFIICFSIDSRASFDNIKDKWALEVAHFANNAPIILVGNKVDLRDDPAIAGKKSLISKDEGEKLARDIGAVKYLECSARNKVGLTDVFEHVVQSFQSRYAKEHETRPQKHNWCNLI